MKWQKQIEKLRRLKKGVRLCLIMATFALIIVAGLYIMQPREDFSMTNAISSLLPSRSQFALGGSHVPQISTGVGEAQWTNIKGTGTEANLTFFAVNQKDKKTSLCWVLQPGKTLSDTSDRFLRYENGTVILDDKDKEIALKWENSAQCGNQIGYHIDLTTIAAQNIDDYVKLGNDSSVSVYQNTSTVVFEAFPGVNITAQVYKEVGGNFSLYPDEVFVSFDTGKWKFGANDIVENSNSWNQYKYTISAPTNLIERNGKYVFGTSRNGYEVDLQDICSKSYTEGTQIDPLDGFTEIPLISLTANCKITTSETYYDVEDPEFGTIPVLNQSTMEVTFWSDNLIDPVFTLTQIETGLFLDQVEYEVSNMTRLNISGLNPYGRNPIYYSFETSESVIHDIGPLGKDGTFSGNAFINTTGGGQYGDFLDLDGDTDYATFGTMGSTNFTQAWSITMWLKLEDGHDASDFVFGAQNTTTGGSGTYVLGRMNASGSISLLISDGGAESGTTANSVFADGVNPWKHVAIVADYDTTNQLYIYIDGVVQSLDPAADGDLTGINPVLMENSNLQLPMIGARNLNGVANGQYLNASYDEIMFFANRILNASQVAEIYNNQSGRFKSLGNQTYPHTRDDEQGDLGEHNAVNVSVNLKTVGNENVSVRVGSWNVSYGYLATDINGNNELHAYWSADGNALDNVGRYNGTFVGANANNVGVFNNSFDFDGINDYVNLTGTRITEATQGTITAWIKSDSDMQLKNIFSYGGSAIDAEGLFGFHTRDIAGTDRIHILQRSDGDAYNLVGGSTELVQDVWYHVAATSDGSAWKLYVNGVEESLTITLGANNGNWIGDTTVTSPVENHIGNLHHDGTETQFWNGSIDELLLFNRSLSGQEVKEIYTKSRANWQYNMSDNLTIFDKQDVYNFIQNDSRLVAYWHFDGDFLDATGRYNGTAEGSAVISNRGGRLNTESVEGNGASRVGIGDITEIADTPNLVVAAWVKNDDTATAGNPEIIEDADTSHVFRIYWDENEDYEASMNLNGASRTITADASVVDTDWHHVAIRWNGTTFSLWQDGVEQTDTYVGSGNTLAGATNVDIMGTGTEWDGLVDEVIIINGSLNDAQMRDLYKMGTSKFGKAENITIGGNSTNLLLELTLDSNAVGFFTPYITSDADMITLAVPPAAAPPPVDNPPTLSITHPVNGSNHSQVLIDLNYTISDDNGFSTCFYTLDGGVTNQSLTCGDNVTETATQGSNVWAVYVNDTTDQFASDFTNFTVDLISPTWSNNISSPESPVVYNATQRYEFNITWTENLLTINTVLLEFDEINYTPTSSGSVYNYTFASLGGGTYSYHWFANDSAGNSNVSDTYSYVVNQAAGVVNLTINGTRGDVTISTGDTININGTFINGTGILDLYENGTLINNGTAPISNISTYNSVGQFEYNLTYLGNENYTADEELWNVTVIDSGIPAVTNVRYWALNGSQDVIGNETAFNTENLTDIEYMKINFTVTDNIALEGDIIFYYTAGGEDSCATGNNQTGSCYNLSNDNWIEFRNGTDTFTFKDEGVTGDFINLTYTGTPTKREYTLIIDEHYNPNIMKWYNASYNFSDIEFQDGASQRITRNNQLRVNLTGGFIPLDADQYKLDFRVQVTGNPANLESYACNSNYTSGAPELSTNCSLVASLGVNDLQDDGTKYRAIFTKNLIDNLGDLQYIVLRADEPNLNERWAVKTLGIQNTAHNERWDYSTDDGDTWTNSNSGYEVEMNLNWFFNGVSPTSIHTKIFANDGAGNGINSTETNMTWTINATKNYPPVVIINSPDPGEVVNLTYTINWSVVDPNDDFLQSNITLHNSTFTLAVASDLDWNTLSFDWNTRSISDGTYNLTITSWENSTADLFTVNDTHQINLSNPPDIEAPNITLLTPFNNTYTNRDLWNYTANFSDVTGLSNTTFYIWNSTNDLQQSNFTNITGINNETFFEYVFLVEDTYHWNYEATDEFTNTGFAPSNFTVTYDITPPVINVTNPLNNSVINISTITLRANNLSEVMNDSLWVYSLDQGANLSFTPGVTNIIVSDGFHNITMCGFDLAGNVGCDTENNWEVATTAPSGRTVFITTSTGESFYKRGDLVRLFVSLDDPSGTPLNGETILIDIDYPNGSIMFENVNPIEEGLTGNYEYNFTLGTNSGSAPFGTYNVYYEHANAIATNTFRVTDPTTPTSTESTTRLVILPSDTLPHVELGAIKEFT